MSEVYTEAELLIRVRHLTRAQLTAFVEAQVVVPTLSLIHI